MSDRMEIVACIATAALWCAIIVMMGQQCGQPGDAAGPPDYVEQRQQVPTQGLSAPEERE